MDGLFYSFIKQLNSSWIYCTYRKPSIVKLVKVKAIDAVFNNAYFMVLLVIVDPLIAKILSCIGFDAAQYADTNKKQIYRFISYH